VLPEDAKLVSLWISQNDPGRLTLANVDSRRPESEQAINLGKLVDRAEVEVEPSSPSLSLAP
jgi:hypothetical protein